MFWIKCPDIYSHCVNTVSWWWEWVSTTELSEGDPQAGQGHAPLVSAPSWGRLGWCLVSPTLPPTLCTMHDFYCFFFNLVILFFKEGVLQGCVKVTHPWVFVDFSTFECPWQIHRKQRAFPAIYIRCHPGLVNRTSTGWNTSVNGCSHCRTSLCSPASSARPWCVSS